MRAIRANESTAARRVVLFPIVDDTAAAAPWAGSVTGVKALVSINGGTETPTSADIRRVAGIMHAIDLTQGEVNLPAGSYGVGRVPAAAGRREAFFSFSIFADDVFAPAATTGDIATAVDAQLAPDFAAIPAATATAVAAPSAATIATAVESQLANEFAAIPSAVDAALADNFAAIPAAVVSAILAASDGRAFGVTTVPPGGTTVPLAVRNAGGAVIGTRQAFYTADGQLVGLTAVA